MCPAEAEASGLCACAWPVLCRKIRELHLEACDQLQVEASVRAEVERLLKELLQLLVGIGIMQVGPTVCDPMAHGPFLGCRV